MVFVRCKNVTNEWFDIQPISCTVINIKNDKTLDNRVTDATSWYIFSLENVL